jgi:hypothetical protein
MKRSFRSNFVTVLILFLTAVLISVLVYPEVFITFKTSFVLWADYSTEYPLTFVLTNMFYQGGLQLWNFFGQMPFFHTYEVWGFSEFSNLITAIAYYALAPFSQDSSQLFHHVFAWGQLMTLLLMRVIGIFLLLNIVTRNRYILTIGTVVFAVFFCQMAFLRGVFWGSYNPLGMYFIVRFFQGLQWRYLATILIFFALRISGGVLGEGYMYLPMHFFIIAGVLWRVFCYKGPRAPSDIRFGDALQWRKMAGIIFIMALILAPYLYVDKFGLPDLSFGQGDSRLVHMFSPAVYFHKLPLDLGGPTTFFSDILNFQTMNSSTLYEGWTFLFLALAGFILSRNTLRYFFALTIFFLWLLSFPREGLNIGLIAHWINALTNPLKTIPRAYVTSCQAILPYLLMPLAVMGIEAMYELYQGKKYSGFALGMLAITTIVLTMSSISVLPDEVRIFLISCTVLMITGIGWSYFRNSVLARKFLLGTICFLAVIDVLFIIHQTKMQFAQFDRKPTVLDISPQSGMVGYDFENPAIFPYSYSYAFHFSYRDEAYLWFPHSISSDMHHVINQALNYTYLNGYNPRHVEFAKWLNDPEMLAYLTQNNEFIFLAQAAINASPGALSRICSAGLARQVIEVEDPGQSLQLPDQWPGDIIGKERDDRKYDQIVGTLGDVNGHSEHHLQGDMIMYTLHLPSNFPEHLASSWFPSEQPYLRFLVDGIGQHWQELQNAQGELIRPYTFDVQNIKKGDLNAVFPKNDFPLSRKYVVLYPSSENQGVERLWRRQFDNLGIIYRAKKDGWLVGHYPYDTKWKISVDGKPVTYYRVDKSFIGFPLTQGEHKILIQYWPHSPLRILLLISALLTTVGLPVLIFLALKWEQGRDKIKLCSDI